MHNKSIHIPSLDGIRAVSVLVVVMSHCGFEKIAPGGLGVTAFFFLSGYLITTLLLNEKLISESINVKNFYLRRFFRLAPALLITVSISYSFVILGWLPGKVTLSGLASQLLYYFNYFALFSDGINKIPQGTQILWSLAVEEHFYIFYPFLMSILLTQFNYKKIGILFIYLCLLVLFWRYYLTFGSNFNPDRNYYATDTRIDSIFFGCILATLKNPIENLANRNSMSKLDWLIITISIAVIIITLTIKNQLFISTLKFTVQGMALMPLFYYGIVMRTSLIYRFLNLNYLRLLGAYSYSIYLIHYVVINVILVYVAKLNMQLHSAELLLIVMLLTISYAFLIDRYVEPYFRQLRKKFS